jgi:hypothetical protein
MEAASTAHLQSDVFRGALGEDELPERAHLQAPPEDALHSRHPRVVPAVYLPCKRRRLLLNATQCIENKMLQLLLAVLLIHSSDSFDYLFTYVANNA